MTSAPSLTSFGRGQGLAQSVSSLDSCRACVCEAWRWSEHLFVLGAGLCFGHCWQWLSVPIPTAITCISLVCLAQATGAPRGARAAAEVSWLGTCWGTYWWQWSER